MIYHPSYTQIGHFMGRETVYCNLNSNMVEGVGTPALLDISQLPIFATHYKYDELWLGSSRMNDSVYLLTAHPGV